MAKRIITLDVCRGRAMEVAQYVINASAPHERILYGIPRGGIAPALMVADAINRSVPKGLQMAFVTDDPDEAFFFIDDVIDSGSTRDHYVNTYGSDTAFLALFDKKAGRDQGWLVFPWEITHGGDDQSDTDIIIRLLQTLGEDPQREGLLETPARVMKAWKEWSSGYEMDPKTILKTFKDGADGVNELVIVHDIPVVSKCEHHLADIIGLAQVGYIPDGNIVGLSKLARLVECFARRLQVQERLTNQIADALMEHVQPKGVGVLITAGHACMSTRGVKIHGSETTTSALRGCIFDEPAARHEFMLLANRRS